MNERIKELAEQAGISYLKYISEEQMELVERFAELVRQDEREACAKLLESTDLTNADEYQMLLANILCKFAEAIRARKI